MVDYGTPLSPDQRVDSVVYFDNEELGRALIKAAIEKAGLPFGTWGGHVCHSVSPDAAKVTATVYVWKDEGLAKE
jgi:hypothetical protein